MVGAILGSRGQVALEALVGLWGAVALYLQLFIRAPSDLRTVKWLVMALCLDEGGRLDAFRPRRKSGQTSPSSNHDFSCQDQDWWIEFERGVITMFKRRTFKALPSRMSL